VSKDVPGEKSCSFPDGICLSYQSLEREDVFAMLKLRQDVFIIEQDCIYPDIDAKDRHSSHFFLWEGEPYISDLMSYCRIVKPGISYVEPSIGRVVSCERARGHGWGREMMRQAINMALELYPDQGLRISAQAYLERFYQSFGFVTVSDPYLEDDIPHVEMLLNAE